MAAQRKRAGDGGSRIYGKGINQTDDKLESDRAAQLEVSSEFQVSLAGQMP